MDEIESLVASLKRSKKYQDTAEDTIRQLVEVEAGRHKRARDVERAVRKRLHNIMAPYLGDPDYPAALAELREVYAGDDEAAIKVTCARIMAAHDSTRERLPILDSFYRRIFDITGPPESILDLACGLDPLALPWMDAPGLDAFYAYDIHEPRIAFLNDYFDLCGLPRLAKVQDVAYHPPQETADVALFLKEIPRFERNYEGGTLRLLESLRAHWIVVSFPTISLHGGRSLESRYRDFFHSLIAGTHWPASEVQFDSELVFCIERTNN